MKNFIQKDETLTIPAPAGGVVSGQFVIVGALIGVATTTVAAGLPVAMKREGVFEFAKVSAQAWAVGDKIYWDPGVSMMTNVAGSLAYVGAASEAAVNPSSVGRVSLRRFAS